MAALAPAAPTLLPGSALLLARAEALGLKLLALALVAALGLALMRLTLRLAAPLIARLDPTLAGFATGLLRALLALLLFGALLGVGGIALASFAALFAAFGIAVGGAVSGLLADVAAGLLLLLLRPFEVGDEITTADISGTVTAIGVFRTLLTGDDNVALSVGNAALLGTAFEHRPPAAQQPLRRGVLLRGDVDARAIAAALEPELAGLGLVRGRVRVEPGDGGTQRLSVRGDIAVADAADAGFALARLIAQHLPPGARAAPPQPVTVAPGPAQPALPRPGNYGTVPTLN